MQANAIQCKMKPLQVPAFPNVLCFFILLLVITLLKPSSSSTTLIPREAAPTKSGYLLVNSTSLSSIFYAFYEAQQPISSDLSTTPVIIWLEGGPGCSSMLANFNEVGPWQLNKTTMLHLDLNPGAWNRIFGLVFFDNPIGTGFSAASFPEEIPRDQDTVAEHLFVAIKSFIGSNPGFKDRPVYLTGESYGGKYVPTLGFYIAEKNIHSPKQDRVNLVGIAVGNGLTDPVSQVKTHASSAYYSGLINENQRSQWEKMQSEVVKFIDQEKWGEATNARKKVLNMLENMRGLATLFDPSRKTPCEELRSVEIFLGNYEVKMALGQIFHDQSILRMQ